MLYQDYNFLARRWRAFWQFENHDRPLIHACAPKSTQKPPIAPPPTRTAQWEDIDYLLASHRRTMENTFFGGEAFPVFNPNLGLDIVGAVAGCDIVYGADTSWAEPCVTDWDAHPPLRFSEENTWWKKIERITKAAVSDANGDYLVGITDLHPGTDGLVSLRGPQEMCYDLIDYADAIVPRCNELFEVYTEMHRRLAALIAPAQQGSANWMGIWHPEKEWYVVGSDFSCMLSPADFDQFVMPGLMREIDFLPESMYHLDGPDALRHLDAILSIEKLGGVQWVYGAGQPTARYWLDVLRKIQNAGKRIQIHCVADDVVPVCEALRPEGVHIVIDACKDEAEALQLIEAAAQASRMR